MAITYNRINLPDVIGKGYREFWNSRHRYRVVKGSRRSKKSKTMALWLIYHMMKYRLANALVVRKTYRTLHDSCFTELKWAINRLGVSEWWECKESPLEITYKPTKQKIYFRGLDDPLKITSITTETGILSWMWIEEAYEITSESDFDTLCESMLGDLPVGLWKQITLTFNPWNESTWLKKRFFDQPDKNVLAITTNYLCNEWLSPEDIAVFDDMKIRNPRRYEVAGLGNWGISEGLIYDRWVEEFFYPISKREYNERDNKPNNPVFTDFLKPVFGLDFGYTNDPSALFCGLLDPDNKKLYVFDELYEKGLSNRKIYESILNMGYSKERITADSAEPKSIDELCSYGLRVSGAKKGKDSIQNGIQWIQDLEIVIHPRCVNFITEISNYSWAKDKFGNQLNKPIDDFNHLMDAMRYGLESCIVGNKWLF